MTAAFTGATAMMASTPAVRLMLLSWRPPTSLDTETRGAAPELQRFAWIKPKIICRSCINIIAQELGSWAGWLDHGGRGYMAFNSKGPRSGRDKEQKKDDQECIETRIRRRQMTY
jgi:hypothetical protein